MVLGAAVFLGTRSADPADVALQVPTDVPLQEPTDEPLAEPTDEPLREPPIVVVREFASGLEAPLAITHAGDGSGELYVVERAGTIRRVSPEGDVAPEPVLDIREQVSTEGERGLLAMTFPPDEGPKDHFYAYYVDTEGTITLSRFGYNGEAAGDETVLVHIPRGRLYHWGGALAWGPDGLLYFATGDAASGGDPLEKSQDPDSPHAKLYRFDPNVDNAGDVSLEVLGMGLRNPYRFSFDPETGELYLADVGEARREEVNIVPFEDLGGEVLNFGWNIFEGNDCFEGSAIPCDANGLVMPELVYEHGDGRCSIIGGHVYRGEEIDGLQGHYLYGDYCSGEIFGVGGDPRIGLGLSGFGLDEQGEVYLTDIRDGLVYRLEPEE